MRPSSALMIAAAALAVCACGCFVDTAGAPCGSDENCPSGQACGSDGLCALGATGEKDTGAVTEDDAGAMKDAGHKDAAESDVPGSDAGGGDPEDDAGSADAALIDAGPDGGKDGGLDAGRDAGADGGADAGDGGACQNECAPKGARECVTQNAWRECADVDNDGCLEWSLQTACLYGCESGDCKPCVPDCAATAKECGADGCGGSCGACMSPAADYCTDYLHYRVYDRPGTCLASFRCLYSYSERPCPGGCDLNADVCVSNTLATWSRTYNPGTYGRINAVAISKANSDMFAAGVAGLETAAADGWVMRLRPSGDIVWSRRIGGPARDELQAVAATGDDGCIAAGFTEPGGVQSGDGWVVKLNAGGEVEWEARYGGQNRDELRAVRQLSDGSFVAAGMTKSWGAGREEMWALRILPGGAIQWQKYYGGTDDDAANAAAIAADGGIHLAGYTASFGVGYRDFLVVKVSADTGAMVSSSVFGSENEDQAVAAVAITDGVVVAGTTGIGASVLVDAAIVKLNTSGELVWGTTVGGDLVEAVRGLLLFASGEYLVVGSTSSFNVAGEDGWLARVKIDGSLAFQKTFGLAGEDTFAGAVQLPSANVIVAGSRNDPQGLAEGWITEVKADGSYDANCPSGFGKSASGAAGPSGFTRTTNINVSSGDSNAKPWPLSSEVDPWQAAFSDQCAP